MSVWNTSFQKGQVSGRGSYRNINSISVNLLFAKLFLQKTKLELKKVSNRFVSGIARWCLLEEDTAQVAQPFFFLLPRKGSWTLRSTIAAINMQG